ncbi:MAG: apolipoprotein N-acyltransferase [Actinomycetota bacterium]
MQEVLPGEASESAEGQDQDALPGLRLSLAGLRLPLALAIVLLSGAALSLALPPADLGPVAFVALVPLLVAVRDAPPRRGAFLGLAFGFAYFGAVLYWILLFGELAWLTLSLTSAAFIAIFGLFAPAVWRSERPLLSVAGLSSLWIVVEWARSMWPVGGFTWGGLGTTQAGNGFLMPLASVAGVWGLSFVVVLVNGLLLLSLERWRGRGIRARALVPIGASVALVLAPGLIPLPAPNGPTLDVAVLQVDVRRARGLDPLAEDRAVAEMNVALHEGLTEDPPDLVVWGESALDPGAQSGTTWARVTGAIADVGVPTLAGAVTPDPAGRFHNQGLLFDAKGTVVDRYTKVHLVPFGEYVPWRAYLDWISALGQIPYDIVPGSRLHTLELDGLRFGNVICFENSFPSLDRALVAGGAGFLVITTNNASYELTAASRQHVIMSRLRAVENGRWVVHAAVSGISAFIDPTGRVVARTGLFAPGVVRHPIRASAARTLYTRFGDWLPLASLALASGLVLAPGRRRGRAAVVPLSAKPRTLVILPTYNERPTIEAVLAGVLGVDGVDVVVVDDASADGTAEAVRRVAAHDRRVRLVSRPSKSGLASAYLVGFRIAVAEGYDLVVEMDADMSHDPSDLPRLLAAASDHDLAIGSRYVPGGSVTNWSRPRRALSRAGNAYARLALGLPLRDSTSGYRVFRSASLRPLLHRPIRSDGYGFQIEMAYRAWTAGHSLVEVPITFREREHGHSKISRRIVLEALWLVTVWGIRARFRPSPRARAERP